nr:nonribosomal peptide synthetase tes [Quercus suber]
MRLVAAARRIGIQLTVSSVFKDPRLSEVAASASTEEIAVEEQHTPWSMVPKAQLSAIESDVQIQCGLSAIPLGAITDVYPTTALQEGLMALAIKQPGSYMARYTFELATGVDVERFKSAWEQTVQACAALRTRVILSGDQSWQAVIDEEPSWGWADSLSSYMSEEMATHMGYGSKLCRYSLIADGERKLFGLTVHHAIFDGWSIGLVMQTLSSLFDADVSVKAALTPYVGFVRYAHGLDTARASEYWRAQLQNASRPLFPRTRVLSSPSSASPAATGSFTHKLPLANHSSSSITKATILRAAWAIVLARYNDNADDITFGASVAGRQAPVAGVEQMVGPIISTVPVRVKLSSQQPTSHFLRDIQVQGAEMIPFEQTGLQNIAKLGPDAREACGFSTLLVIQPKMIVSARSSSLFEDVDAAVNDLDPASLTRGYFTYPLVVQCYLYDEDVVLDVTFDTSVLCKAQLKRMAVQYEYVVGQLVSAEASDDSAHKLGSISLCGPQDVAEMQAWNADIKTEVVSSCFHTLVEEQARVRPTAPAISAWDGEFSYQELNAAADRLAYHLVTRFNVAKGDLVALCFEKSAWIYVAMLAVNKAGGAWVPLDPSHPSRRHHQVIEQAGARLALTSPENTAKCSAMLDSVVEVSPALDMMLAEKQGSSSRPPKDLASPRDAAYVLFTSGTTGTPKGIVMVRR